MKRLKLRVRWKEGSLEDFVAHHADDFTLDDFFLPTAAPLSEGTEVGFEFLLADGRTFFEGRGVVDAVSAPGARPGMTIRHTELSASAAELLRALSPPAWEERTPIFPVDPSLLGEEEDPERFDEDTAAGLDDEEREKLLAGER